jgi:transposase
LPVRDRDRYAQLLGIQDLWSVRRRARLDVGVIEIFLALDERAELACPVCGATIKR